MRFDQLPIDMILKIAGACEPKVEQELKYTNRRLWNNIEYYLKDRRCSKISYEKSGGRQSLSLEVVTPNNFRGYGPYTQGNRMKKTDRERFERFTSVEIFSLEGYDELSMFWITDSGVALKGFTRLRKIVTIFIQKCPMDYSSEWCEKMKRITKQFNVENLEVGGFQVHGVALPVAEAINMLEAIRGNMVVSYAQRTPSYYDDRFLENLSSKPRNRLCLGKVSTQFTYGAVLRTIKKILVNGWKVDWNLGSIQIDSNQDFKKFKEHRKNLVDFAKKQLNVELSLAMYCPAIVPPHLTYIFTDETNGSRIMFGTENVASYNTINASCTEIIDKEIFIGFKGNLYML